MDEKKFRAENRPSDPATAAEWDKDFDFHKGEQWTPEQLSEARALLDAAPVPERSPEEAGVIRKTMTNVLWMSPEEARQRFPASNDAPDTDEDIVYTRP